MFQIGVIHELGFTAMNWFATATLNGSRGQIELSRRSKTASASRDTIVCEIQLVMIYSSYSWLQCKRSSVTVTVRLSLKQYH